MPTNNTLIFLKHSKTIIDQNIPVSEWELSPDGFKKLKDRLTNSDFKNIEIIISSSEKKAIKTAEIFANYFDLEIIVYDNFRELNRDKGNFGTSETYLENVKDTITFRSQSFNNWETADNALRRFNNGMKKINENYQKKKILIVSHGIIINLYFAYLRGNLSKTYDFWLLTDFCDYGITKNNIIIKDITYLSDKI